ncbi:MAG: fasciclin domain-containing protein [Bacteroidota bacterium]
MIHVNPYLSRILLALVALLISLGLRAQTIYDVVANSPDHNTLETAIDTAQLRTALSDPNTTLTLFAPTDAAFAALGDVVTDLLMDPTGQLADILRYHVLNGEVASSAVTNGLITTPLNDANTVKLTRTSVDDNLFINHAQITVRDVPATNGTVHVIDAVILPVETVVDVAIDNEFTTLTTAVVEAELLPVLTNPADSFTVFAPTNDAFAALGDVVTDLLMDPTGDLADILRYHVLGSIVPSSAVTNGLIATPVNDANTLKFTNRSADGAIFVNHAQVTMPDVTAANGTVHVIDAVVLPVETVVDVAIDNEFTTLTTAVVEAELLPALTDPAGTYTVFAPVDSAFAALGDTLTDLLADPTGDLADILLYHVLGDTVSSGRLVDGSSAETLFPGNFIFVDLSDGVVINDSRVIQADVPAANGIVHVINRVLRPNFPLSVNELQETPFEVFPNPTADFININAAERNYQYQVYSVSGARQLSGNLLPGSNRIDLSRLPGGLYFVQIFDGSASTTLRLVVNR